MDGIESWDNRLGFEPPDAWDKIQSSVTRLKSLRQKVKLKVKTIFGALAWIGVARSGFGQGVWPPGGGFGGASESFYSAAKPEIATPEQIANLVSKLGPGVSHRLSGCTPPPAWGFGTPADETAAQLVRIGPAAVPFVLHRIVDKNDATRALVIEILARINDARVLPVLIEACHKDPSESVRLSAAEGLSYRSDSLAAAALVPALLERNRLIQCFAIRALTRSPQEAAIDPLAKLMAPSTGSFPSIGPSLTSANVSEQAAFALGAIGPNAFPTILQLMHSSNDAVRRVGGIALTQCNDRRSLPALWQMCMDPDDMTRLRAANALARWVDHKSILVLTKLMRAGGGNSAGMAAQSLARMGGPALAPYFAAAKDPVYAEMVSNTYFELRDRAAAPMLIEMLKSKSPRVRDTALYKLSIWSEPRALPQIFELTRDPDMERRRLAIGMLGLYDGRCHPEIIEPLIHAMTDKHEWIRSQAAGALFGKDDARIGPAMIQLLKCNIKDVPPLAQQVLNPYHPRAL